MLTWVEEPGFPLVTVERDWNARYTVVMIMTTFTLRSVCTVILWCKRARVKVC